LILAASALLIAGCRSGTDPLEPVPAANPASASAGLSVPPPVTPTATAAPVTAVPVTAAPVTAVPDLVGRPVGDAKAALTRRGLRWTVTYRSTAGSPAGTVIAQSTTAGSTVSPGAVIALVIAKRPPAPRTTTAPPPAPPVEAAGNCDPAYPDACLHDGIGDYDCAAGSGNGPNYVHGPIRVLRPDPFGLDRDGDGTGCESG
jgi:hypothetical protein